MSATIFTGNLPVRCGWPAVPVRPGATTGAPGPPTSSPGAAPLRPPRRLGRGRGTPKVGARPGAASLPLRGRPPFAPPPAPFPLPLYSIDLGGIPRGVTDAATADE